MYRLLAEFFPHGTAQVLKPVLPSTGPGGGIHAILRLDRGVARSYFGSADDEEIAVSLVKNTGVHLHPGYLYGIEEEDPEFVMSFLSTPEKFREGFRRISRFFNSGRGNALS